MLNVGSEQKTFKVLLIEDQPSSQVTVMHFMNSLGIVTVPVLDGISGIKEFCNEDFDLIIVDWKMPYMDGDKVIRRLDTIVNDPDYGKNIRKNTPFIIYSSANFNEIQIPKTLSLNFIGYISKTTSITHQFKFFKSLTRQLVQEAS